MDTIVNLDATFAALSDGTRRAILGRLTHGEVGLAELAEPFTMSQTAVSKHVRVLADAGLVQIEKRGRTRYCKLDAATLQPASEWFHEYESFWTYQVDRLAHHLTQENPS